MTAVKRLQESLSVEARVESMPFVVGDGERPTVELDHSGYAVQVKGNEVRLLVDNDTGRLVSDVK